MSSSQQTSIPAESCPAPAIATSDAASKPKPCCVCTQEKSKRDECMLFSNAADPAADCKSTIDQYRTCMAGFGFKV
ncbi:Cytochrome c oxidase copper chaperone [Sporothrix stenoceras]|uniref:Cytochrome c oxidase copper chaperone n=1 Tax=Sporothrix stenoceras TaxID=5173 RepID=A0ABR3ZS68_9PEZI